MNRTDTSGAHRLQGTAPGTSNATTSRRSRRLSDRTLVRSASVLGLLCVSIVSFGGLHGSGVAGASGGAAEPVSTTAPGTTTTSASRTATLVSTPLRMRFAAGSYTGYRFSGSTVVGRKSATLGTATTYDISQRTWVSGKMYVRALTGPLSGYWVATPGHTATDIRNYAPAATIRLSAGRYTGQRFFDRARLSIGRTMNVSATTDFSVVKRATIQGRVHYYLASGPLAARWIASSASVRFVTPTISNGTSPNPTPSVAPSADPVTAPESTATARPTVTPTVRPTATATVTPSPRTSTAPAPTATAPTTATTVWKTLVIVYRQTDITFRKADGTSYRLRATISDADLALSLKYVRETAPVVNSWSAGLVTMDMTVVQPSHPVTKVDPLGDVYWMSPGAVKADLDTYAPDGKYDSVIVIWQNWDASGQTVPTRGWGLTIPGGSWSNGNGFSSILVPPQSWWYTNAAVPSEVFVHEWLHQVIYHYQNTGIQLPDLHAPATYGYTDAGGTWKSWYSAILQGRVRDGDRYVGITPTIWKSSTPSVV